jgi:serine/threonine-protein kinase
MNAILTEDPASLSSTNPTLPPVLERIVNRCLEKQPEERFHSAHDLGIALQTISASAGELSRDSVPLSAVRFRWNMWKVAPAAVALVAAGTLAFLLRPTPQSSQEAQARPGKVSRFSVALPVGVTTGFGPASAIAVSPDGRQIVFAAKDGETTRLYRRAIDAVDAGPIPGTEGASSPFLSPDGSAVAFHAGGFAAGGVLKQVAMADGAPITVTAVSPCYGGDWGTDGTIVYGICPGAMDQKDLGGLKRVPASGGTVESLTRVELTAHKFPQVLPGRKAVLFTERGDPGDYRITVLDLETGKLRVVVERGSAGRYLPTGHVVYALGGNLWAVPFDLEILEATGPPVQIGERVLMESGEGLAHFDISDDGALVYLPGGLVDTETQLVWVDRSGKTERLPVVDVSFSPRVSPDGTRLLFCRQRGGADIWVHDLETGAERKLTPEEGPSWWAVWAPDGESFVVDHRSSPGRHELVQKAADGSRSAESLTKPWGLLQPFSFSADGAIFAFQESNDEQTGHNIWTLSMTDDRTPRPFLREEVDELHPAISPNGKWLAYASNETGRYEVSVQPLPGPGGVVPISADGGWEPIWSPDGRGLFYRDVSGRKILSVLFDTTAAVPSPGRPRLVAEGPFVRGRPHGRQYDVAPDGRFLVIVQDAPPPPTEYHVVLNWFEELESRFPGAGSRSD